jgi:hypothetical protein
MNKLLKDIFQLWSFLFIQRQVCEDHSYDMDCVSLVAVWRSFKLLFITPSQGRVLFPSNDGSILFDYRRKPYCFIAEIKKDGYEFLCVDVGKSGVITDIVRKEYNQTRVAELINEYFIEYIK